MKTFAIALVLVFASMGLASANTQTEVNAGVVHAAQAQTLSKAKITTHSFELVASAHADGLAEPASPTEAIGMLPALINAIKASNWGMVASLLLMLLVYGLKSWVIPNASAGWSAFLAAFLPVVGMLAASLYAGQPILQSLLSALFVGAAASGMWEWVGKKVLPTK